jgi:hypothetical protein
MGSGPKEQRARPGYLSYLLRLWQVDAAGEDEAVGGTEWRGSLDSSLTGERQGFATPDELIEFLQQQMGSVAEIDDRQG